MNTQPHLVGRAPEDPDLSEDEHELENELEGAELGAAILARAKENYARDLRRIEIPELQDERGRPFVLYARAVTFRERDSARRKATRRGELDEGEYAARLVVAKACDARGQKLWNVADLRGLVGAVDSAVWTRVAKEILGDGFPDELDEEETGDAAGN